MTNSAPDPRYLLTTIRDLSSCMRFRKANHFHQWTQFKLMQTEAALAKHEGSQDGNQILNDIYATACGMLGLPGGKIFSNEEIDKHVVKQCFPGFCPEADWWYQQAEK